MKVRIFLPILLLVALLLAGCQSAAPTTQPGEPAETQAPAQENPVASSDPAAYPGPGQNEPAIAEAPAADYPASGEGDVITWDRAKFLVMNGDVVKVVQTPDLQVKLFLKDSRTVVTNQPELDDIINLLKNCGEFCKNIEIATE